MRLPIFLIVALVLFAFAIAATHSVALTFIDGISWTSWLCAALMAVVVHLWKDWDLADLFTRKPAKQTPPPES